MSPETREVSGLGTRCDRSPRPRFDPPWRRARALVSATVLALTAALAFTAGWAEAHALPEWGQCIAAEGQAAGRYGDPGCTTQRPKGTRHDPGGYVWTPLGDGRRLNLRLVSAAVTPRFETVAGAAIECGTLGGESFARAEGPSSAATPLWEMKQCHAGSQECHTGTAGMLGEINDFYAWLEEALEPGRPAPGWRGRLGWIDRASSRVGIQYTTANRERLFDPISCAGPMGTVWIGGEPGRDSSIVAAVTPVDTMTPQVTETYAQSAPGVPQPSRLAHHRAATIGAFLENRWEPVALTASITYQVESSSGEIEIRAHR